MAGSRIIGWALAWIPGALFALSCILSGPLALGLALFSQALSLGPRLQPFCLPTGRKEKGKETSSSSAAASSSSSSSSSVPRVQTAGLLKDKTIWITGASSGLGRELAITAAAASHPPASVILSGRNKDVLEKVAQECREASSFYRNFPEIRICAFDLGSGQHGEISSIGASFSDGVDILVNCAGVSHRGSFLSTNMSVHQNIMNVNYFGPVALVNGILPGMISSAEAEAEGKTGPCSSKRKKGKKHIVFINSIQGKIGIAHRTAYSASKHALAGFCDCLRAECSSEQIQVSCFFPGYISTNLSANALTGDGSLYNRTDTTTLHGMDPKLAAIQIWENLDRNEVLLAPLKIRLACLLRALRPDFVFRKVEQRFRKEQQQQQQQSQREEEEEAAKRNKDE